jgi:type IV secretory pathway VirB3-like protein
MKLDTVFRGCTRPQLVLGVPMIPILFVFGIVVLLCMWFSGKFIAILPIFYVIMRAMVKIDEHIFDLLALRLRVAVKTVPNTKSMNGDLIIGPHNFKS